MNESYLEGLKCPNCGSEEPLKIEIKTIISVWDDASDFVVDGDVTWDEDSYCECENCSFYGTVKEFKLENQHG